MSRRNPDQSTAGAGLFSSPPSSPSPSPATMSPSLQARLVNLKTLYEQEVSRLHSKLMRQEAALQQAEQDQFKAYHSKRDAFYLLMNRYKIMATEFRRACFRYTVNRTRMQSIATKLDLRVDEYSSFESLHQALMLQITEGLARSAEEVRDFTLYQEQLTSKLCSYIMDHVNKGSKATPSEKDICIHLSVFMHNIQRGRPHDETSEILKRGLKGLGCNSNQQNHIKKLLTALCIQDGRSLPERLQGAIDSLGGSQLRSHYLRDFLVWIKYLKQDQVSTQADTLLVNQFREVIESARRRSPPGLDSDLGMKFDRSMHCLHARGVSLDSDEQETLCRFLIDFKPDQKQMTLDWFWEKDFGSKASYDHAMAAIPLMNTFNLSRCEISNELHSVREIECRSEGLVDLRDTNRKLDVLIENAQGAFKEMDQGITRIKSSSADSIGRRWQQVRDKPSEKVFTASYYERQVKQATQKLNDSVTTQKELEPQISATRQELRAARESLNTIKSILRTSVDQYVSEHQSTPIFKRLFSRHGMKGLHRAQQLKDQVNGLPDIQSALILIRELMKKVVDGQKIWSASDTRINQNSLNTFLFFGLKPLLQKITQDQSDSGLSPDKILSVIQGHNQDVVSLKINAGGHINKGHLRRYAQTVVNSIAPAA